MRGGKKQVWGYEIETLNPVDYRLSLTFKIKGSAMRWLFKTSRAVLRSTKGIKADGEIKDIDNFIVPHYYYGQLKVFVKKPFKITNREHFNCDGIDLISYDIDNAYFKRDGKNWVCVVNLKGCYAKFKK